MNFTKLEKNLIKELNINIDKKDEVYALIKDKKIIGIGIIYIDKNTINLCISENYQSNGYGTILFKNLLKKLKEYNYKEICIQVQRENVKLRKIIEKYENINISTNNGILEYIVKIN